jgi:biopolymer transport protein ExbB/TolQ
LPALLLRQQTHHTLALTLPEKRLLLSIIQAAGWPIWPLIACSIIALALVFERFYSLRTSKIAPVNLIEEALTVARNAVPGPDVVKQLRQTFTPAWKSLAAWSGIA